MKFPLNSEIYDFQSFTQRTVVQKESFKGQSTGKWQLGLDVSRDSPLRQDISWNTRLALN